MKLRSMQNTERGQSLVEFTVSLVFILILLAGTIDLARAFLTYMAMRDAAQEGAAYGSVARDDNAESIPCAAIEARVRDTSGTMVDLHSADIQVEILMGVAEASCATAVLADSCLGQNIKVTVRHAAFPLTMPFIGAVIGSQTVPITVVVTDTILMPSCD